MKSRTTLLLVLAIVVLVALSEHLAFNRLFVSDELQNVFTARLLATHEIGNYMASANLLILGPMTWIAGAFEHSAPMLRAERFLFFLLFWLNLILIVRCAGFRLRSKSGALALLLVGTLAPLWHYGFEIRHDNPLLTTVLCAWLAARPLGENGKRRPLLVGLFAVIGQFLAFKAFVYFVPIVLIAIVAAWCYDKRPLWRVLAELAGGAAIAFIACRVIYLLSGTWTIFSGSTKDLAAAVVNDVQRLSPWPTLRVFVTECPVLVLAIVFAAVLTARHWNWRELVSRESLAPEAGFCLAGIVALLVNPTPFPYNLVIPTAAAAVLCLRLRPNPDWKPALIALAVIHVGMWLLATERHYVMTNARQIDVMTTAEQMTDPAKHRVFDGAALVPTRRPPGRFWLITFIMLPLFENGTVPSVRSELARGETPIIIPNYRVLELPHADHEFMARHYVPLAGDFLVTGGRFTQSGPWDCLVPGRYYVATKSSAAIDGIAHTIGPITLAKGAHRVEVPAGEVVWLIWLGPTLNQPPALGPGSAERILLTFA
ncbi:MAG TPA: hypothetical protein VJ901_04940 [Thermoanaerobaculia bacterium]|nr:hypothetical protein [Thermoanaerobaculia bacterium]